ncbi:hypothetical protein OZL46_06505 [Bacillus sonorensis]|nr:hypothetical protein [Bacillus sonorensis]MCY7858142.1 hypothetical protein [Bacillus sonorensis]MCY8088414.1 hypothetical protein [Bacillus sonorensis]MCZ0068072.1 hypothetical protein [Bacillus sonorensis]MCZ0094467.1 hypothetical protein [Bacillus sonorensis]MEC1519491.1 hypothetical protein [Bacillus sonorensis]
MINEFLNAIAKSIEQNKSLYHEIKDGDSFEKHVFAEMKKFSVITNEFNVSKVEHNGSHSFPDLKVTFSNNTIYGVEIKFSASGNWKSKGNSVFESLSNKELDDRAYKDIYVFFGRKPKAREDIQNLEVRFAPYGSSIDKIEVTHSPRFSINMNQKESNLMNLFGLDNTYADFRIKKNEEKNKLLRTYFQQVTKKSGFDKWYMPDSTGEEPTVEPLLFSSLKEAQRQQIIAESFILFPFDLIRKKAYYMNVVPYMISKHFVYSSALRDSFSASGKTVILENEIKYPRILMTFYNHVTKIKEVLRNPPYESFERDCHISWEKAKIEHPQIPINLNKEDSLEYSFEQIIKNYKPEMEIFEIKTNSTFITNIDLSKFYHLELLV